MIVINVDDHHRCGIFIDAAFSRCKPGLREAGVPKHDVGYRTGIMVPAGTPDRIVNALNREIGKILTAPDVKDRLAKIGFDLMPGTSEAFAGLIKAESIEWGRVVQQANIKID